MKQRQGVLDRALQRVVFHRLVFNQSFEDPEMDRLALGIGHQHTVLTITSGGCNALSLLCDEPRQLIAVDSNPAQNYLLELKCAGIRSLSEEEYYRFFGQSRPPGAVRAYRQQLRPLLSHKACRFWDCHVRSLALGIITQGRMGLFFRVLRALLRDRVGQRRVWQFLNLPSLESQYRFYHDHVADRLWAPPARWICTFRPLVWLAGTHPAQAHRVHANGDLYEYIRSAVEMVLTQFPIAGNYFLAQALAGRYLDRHCVPPYMLPENLQKLRRLLGRLEVATSWLAPYLKSLPPASIDRLSLLDIFDWMDRETLEGTRRALVQVTAPGARLVYRSGLDANAPPALPEPTFREDRPLGQELHRRDRTGFYGSLRVFHRNGQ